MSKLNRKTSLTLALLAACALSAPTAFAISVTNAVPPGASTLPSLVANIDVKDAGTVVTLGELDINISNTDLIIGRTTGFSVRIDLADGARFSALGAPAIGPALPGGWTASVAAGGANQSFVVYSVQPAGGTGVINGNALSFAAGAIKLDTVAGLKTAGASVSATVTFADPNTAKEILTPVTAQVIASADPFKYKILAGANPDEKINVSVANGVASKTAFAQNGNFGDAPFYTFDAGLLVFNADPAVNGANGAAFGWAATDTVDVTVTGNFGAFLQTGATVDLVVNGSCASPVDVITGTVAADKVTISSTYLDLQGNAGYLCFTLPSTNADVIDATSIATSVTMTRPATGGTSAASADAMAMSYNGPVAKVYTFNPAGNTTQESFLRISNTGGTGGLVTITGRDDAGTASAGTVSMNLAAGKSIQLTSGDLQNGNASKGLTGALGAGAGKWILTVTGEISGMEVTNLNRNNSSGTVSNLGTPVSGSH